MIAFLTRAARRAWQSPPPEPPPAPVNLTKPLPTAGGYPWDGGTGWLAHEAATLLALADHGGDLTAHQAVHAPHTHQNRS